MMREALSLMREVITWIASCSIPCVSHEGGNQTDEVFNHLDCLLQHPLRLRLALPLRAKLDQLHSHRRRLRLRRRDGGGGGGGGGELCGSAGRLRHNRCSPAP